jgi:hypothetical protein
MVRRRRLFLVVAVILAALAGIAIYFERAPISAWYAVRGLRHASDANRADWVRRVAALGKSSIPGLVATLADPDANVCENAKRGLEAMLSSAPADDGQSLGIARSLDTSFPTFSAQGRQAALSLFCGLVQRTPVEPGAIPILTAAGHTLKLLTAAADGAACPGALDLAAALLDKTEQAEIVEPCRTLIETCLHDQDKDNRLAAIRLAMRPEANVLDRVVALLQDPYPEVRRAALLAVGSADALIRTDDLLQWLHDPDEQVRVLCEKALRSRGLLDSHLRIGKLLTDGRPGVRLQVLELLAGANDLEPAVWIRRLSHDPAPAVRAAAIRAAGEQQHAELNDRLQQMAQNDPCPTVRQLAHYYYLSTRKDR